MSICRRWLEIFDAKVLWRRLDLPKNNNACHSYALDFFDRRSSSTLEEIKMDVSFESKAVEHLLEILEKQKDTLRILHLRADLFADETVSEILSKLNGLLDCRFTRIHIEEASRVSLLTDGIERKEVISNRHKSGLKLKILWNPSRRAIELRVHLLCNLVSFHSEQDLRMETCGLS